MQNSLLTAFLCIVLGVNISAAVSGACVDADFSNNTPVGKTFDIKQADIPPLLKFENGLPVSTSSDWVRRRKELRDQLCSYFIGTFPSKAPRLLKAEVKQETITDFGQKRQVKLTFDTQNKASFEIEVWIPSGNGPFPVMLVAPRYYQMGWANTAVKRGYLVCLYPGVDSNHSESNYPGYESVWTTFRSEYPNATWSEIAVKAWLTSRTLDYILSQSSGYKAAAGQVAIIGHSRYGKQAIIAAALDDRFTSVVARSPGTPISCSYRFAGRPGFNEASVDWPGNWYIDKLKTYYGRENELPVDANAWFGLIAPRRCLIHTAYNDDGDPTFGVERVYSDAKKVYAMLGHEENLRVDYRAGGHNDPDGIINTSNQNHNIDWFDLSFGRGTVTQSQFPERLLHRFDWDTWKSGLSKTDLIVPFASARASQDPADKRARILWSLGQASGGAEQRMAVGDYYTDAESYDLDQDGGQLADVLRVPVVFGSGIKGNIYYKAGATSPMPTVIWLHPYSYPTGYGEAYGVQSASVYYRLASHGYMVLAYDQIGFGSRLLEGSAFYENYPKWSRLGRMVQDVSAAINFLLDGQGKAKSSVPQSRSDSIYLLGYCLGGTVALYSAALDSRVAGVASFCGFTPLRTDTDAKPTGGIRRFWDWHALQPLLGLFNGREAEIPYDYDDVLELIAPRPCLLVTPTRDRMADIGDITTCVDRARRACQANGSDSKLTQMKPDDINRMQDDQHQIFMSWLDGVLGSK